VEPFREAATNSSIVMALSAAGTDFVMSGPLFGNFRRGVLARAA
jgi:hypothetical protein